MKDFKIKCSIRGPLAIVNMNSKQDQSLGCRRYFSLAIFLEKCMLEISVIEISQRLPLYMGLSDLGTVHIRGYEIGVPMVI